MLILQPVSKQLLQELLGIGAKLYACISIHTALAGRWPCESFQTCSESCIRVHVLMQSMKFSLDGKQSVCGQTLQYLLAIKTEPHALHQHMHALNRTLDIRTFLCKHAEDCRFCCYKSLPSEPRSGLYNSMDHVSAEQVTTGISTCTQMVCKPVPWRLPPHQTQL